MAEFNASHALSEVQERNASLLEGEKLVPVSAAVIAVLAALATLFANHSSISGLAQKNEAILYQSKASDQYAYYEAKRIKVHIYQALLVAGAAQASAKKPMQQIATREDAQAKHVGAQAAAYAETSEKHAAQSERFMRSYESHEIAATLFEVSIVLVSITALMRTKALMLVAGAATLVGLGFFFNGLAV